MNSSNFIIIDDDPINNLLCQVVIEQAVANAAVVSFSNAIDALRYLQNDFPALEDATIFLDINMPQMNGWEFLEVYNTLPHSIKSKLKIYIISSSVDARDKQLAADNQNVEDYIEKPLTAQALQLLASTKKI